ncbi:MAG: hypothetical protein M4D85_03510 [Actinomycetota bacterium]|nr:hypothetical protein [Actinomycetota bacterium]
MQRRQTDVRSGLFTGTSLVAAALLGVCLLRDIRRPLRRMMWVQQRMAEGTSASASTTRPAMSSAH